MIKEKVNKISYKIIQKSLKKFYGCGKILIFAEDLVIIKLYRKRESGG